MPLPRYLGKAGQVPLVLYFTVPQQTLFIGSRTKRYHLPSNDTLGASSKSTIWLLSGIASSRDAVITIKATIVQHRAKAMFGFLQEQKITRPADTKGFF